VDNYVNVEMDPEAEVEVRAVIQKQNMTVVGWWVTASAPRPPRGPTCVARQVPQPPALHQQTLQGGR
jgi:hypothetical protein